MKKLSIFVVLSFIPVMIFGFPYGSIMNFNPAYMVYNTQWDASYESYFGTDDMSLMVFQPFTNGFAGKLGIYTEQATSGIVYSLATQSGQLAMGMDFLLSNSGTTVALNVGAGIIQKLSENLDVTVRLPQMVSYIYNGGISVSPDLELGVDLPYQNWSAGTFLNIGQIMKGGIWGSVSLFNLQLLARMDGWYNTSILSSSENTFTFVSQYSIGSINFAYLYQKIWGNIEKSQTNGIRISMKW
jgi:hypothetical protein